MIATSVVILLALGFACTFFWMDATRRKVEQRWTRRDANLEIYRERSEQLKQKEADVSTTNDEASSEELAVALLDDVGDEENGSHPTQSFSQRPLLAMVGAILALSLIGYWFWGDPVAPDLLDVDAQLATANDTSDLDSVIGLLERRIAVSGMDEAGIAYLIHFLFLQEDYSEVIARYRAAAAKDITTPMSDVAFIQASFTVSEGKLDDEAQVAIERVLELEPEQPTVLQILAFSAFGSNQFVEARGYAERSLRQISDFSQVTYVEAFLELVNRRLPEDHVGVRVEVTIESESPHPRWLTIYARNSDSGPPLAVVRRVIASPRTVRVLLDDAVSMLPALELSMADEVAISARLSHSRDVTPRASDQLVVSMPIKPLPGAKVILTIPIKPAS